MKLQGLTGYTSHLQAKKAQPQHSPQAQTTFKGVTNPSNLLQDVNFNQLLIKKPNAISFGNGLVPSDVNMELSNRIASAQYFASSDDVILVGKDFESAKKDLQKILGVHYKLISKVHYIQDESLTGSFMLAQNENGVKKISNLSDSELIFTDTWGDECLLPQGDSAFQRESTLYSFGESGSMTNFILKTDEELDKLSLEEAHKYEEGTKTFDFSDFNDSLILSVNAKNVKNMGGHITSEGEDKRLTFKDVGGQDKAIAELKKAIIYPIKYPQAFKVVNHGTLLEGGPGTGKTLIAEALANEVDAHFIKLNGSEMENKYVGQTEENWRNLFEEAMSNQPAIIFIDEFDSVAKEREGSTTSRHDDKTVNQILSLMSDIEKENAQVYVIASTNKKDLLDSAILRSGRFGNHVQVPNPDVDGCKKIFEIHSKNKQLADDVDSDELAKTFKKKDFNGADIAALVEAAQNNAYLREGIFEKMEDGTFTDSDMDNLYITKEDIDSAIDTLGEKSKIPEKRKIGFVYSEDNR